MDFDAIDDSLLVGSAFDAADVPYLVELGVGAVVSLQAEAPDPEEALQAAGIACTRICCEDFTAPSLGQIDDAVDAIRDHWGAGRRVYLHCFAGLQRSVTIAACALIASDPDRWNAKSALEEVCSKRRHACPMRSQVDAVLDYDRYVRAMRSVG